MANCSHIPRTSIPRREALKTFGLLAVSPIVIGAHTESARADRTGKYSTKLTAKRRYLPRIGKGLRALRDADPQTASDLTSAVAAYDNRRSDFLSALSLFGTSYFAEGNRIGATEKTLKDCVDQLSTASENLVRAANSGNVSAAKDSYSAAMAAVQRYVTTAKLEEIAPDIIPN